MSSRRLFPRLTLLALAASFSLSASAAAPRLLLIDQDAFGPAGSNLQSILMATQAPGVKVLGITVESGDGWCRENLAHVLRLLELIHRSDIPVAAGPDLPLLNTPAATRRWEARYGKLFYKGAWTDAWPQDEAVGRTPPHPAGVVPPLPEGAPHTKPLAAPAAEFLIQTVRAHPGQVSILALGPLTNLALAVKLDPELPRLTKELVIMGGSFQPQPPPGGSPFAAEYAQTPRLEFNFRFDPEAASIVLHQPWPHIVQVPVDPTTTTFLKKADIAELAKAPPPLGPYLGRYARPGFPLWDELAVGVWLDPSLIRREQTLTVDVDIDHGAGYGNTLSWARGTGPGLGEQPVEVIFKVDEARLLNTFIGLMRRPLASAPH